MRTGPEPARRRPPLMERRKRIPEVQVQYDEIVCVVLSNLLEAATQVDQDVCSARQGHATLTVLQEELL